MDKATNMNSKSVSTHIVNPITGRVISRKARAGIMILSDPELASVSEQLTKKWWEKEKQMRSQIASAVSMRQSTTKKLDDSIDDSGSMDSDDKFSVHITPAIKSPKAKQEKTIHTHIINPKTRQLVRRDRNVGLRILADPDLRQFAEKLTLLWWKAEHEWQKATASISHSAAADQPGADFVDSLTESGSVPGPEEILDTAEHRSQTTSIVSTSKKSDIDDMNLGSKNYSKTPLTHIVNPRTNRPILRASRQAIKILSNPELECIAEQLTTEWWEKEQQWKSHLNTIINQRKSDLEPVDSSVSEAMALTEHDESDVLSQDGSYKNISVHDEVGDGNEEDTKE